MRAAAAAAARSAARTFAPRGGAASSLEAAVGAGEAEKKRTRAVLAYIGRKRTDAAGRRPAAHPRKTLPPLNPTNSNLLPATPSTTTNLTIFTRSFASPCNLRLGAPPPPPPITIRYGPRLVDAFVDLADGIEAAVPGLDVDGDETDTEGAFEVAAPGGEQLLWSALARGRPPTVDEVVAAVQSAGVGGGVAAAGEEASCPV